MRTGMRLGERAENEESEGMHQAGVDAGSLPIFSPVTLKIQNFWRKESEQLEQK